jgi:ribA/ribD-fused uncharacterized protein
MSTNEYQDDGRQYMKKYSCFFKDQGYFGNFPSQTDINYMESIGIHYFINLTCDNENLTPYSVSNKSFKVDLPILDRKIPYDVFNFTLLILKSVYLLKNNRKIFIHCKGGHGRSGILVACILKLYLNISPEKAIELTTKYHNEREGVREKWKKIGSPQTFSQKKFVHKIFQPFLFFKAYKIGTTVGLSNFSLHKIQNEIGVFHSSEAMFQAYKNLSNKQYIKTLSKTVNPQIARNIGKKIYVPDNQIQKQLDNMKKILYMKCVQNKEVLMTVLKSGLRPFVQHTKTDRFWGDGGDGSGKNHLGQTWDKVRDDIYNQFLENKIDTNISKFIKN